MKSKPCVGCGYCCIKVQCAPSFFKYGEQKRCPALYWDGTCYRCKDIGEYGSYLAIGEGCCSPLNSWRRKPVELRA